MLAYCTVGTNDMDRALGFYDALLAELGAKRMMELDRGVVYGNPDQQPSPMIAIMKPFDSSKDAACGNGPMTAFAANSREMVDRVYTKALELGGTDEGPNGERFPGFYAGYFRDLDGNKLAIVYFG